MVTQIGLFPIYTHRNNYFYTSNYYHKNKPIYVIKKYTSNVWIKQSSNVHVIYIIAKL